MVHTIWVKSKEKRPASVSELPPVPKQDLNAEPTASSLKNDPQAGTPARTSVPPKTPSGPPPFTAPTSDENGFLELRPLPRPYHGRSRLLMIGLIVLALFCSWYALSRPAPLRGNPTPEAEKLQPVVEQYAAEYGIADHISELMAIMHVESGGKGEDVFQSSESLGLPPNSLSREESIEQGTRFYASLLDRARELGVDQDAVFQAYNFGSGYLDYVARNGGQHTSELAEAFSREYAQGRQVPYNNPIAIERNGGWRYDYGNMFYVDLIHQYLNADSTS